MPLEDKRGKVVILRADARSVPLPDRSVDLIVTSPPYFALRKYTDGGEAYAGQLGAEATAAEYVASLVACTREWLRVLKDEGSLFVNIGDKYGSASGPKGGVKPRSLAMGAGTKWPVSERERIALRPKSLLGIPWRYALACTDELGLILRAEVIWHKSNGLPESTKDRVRRAHEQVFHFVKQSNYYAAVDEIREGYAPGTARRYAAGYNPRAIDSQRLGIGVKLGGDTFGQNPLGKLPGSVWRIASMPLIVPSWLGIDHFAAYPPALVRPIVLGWSPPGVCVGCGQGRRPRALTWLGRKERDTPAYGAGNHGTGNSTLGSRGSGAVITGYACDCPRPDAPTRPAVVLDPLGGTGTTALVASVFGRTGITIDMSADYCRLAEWRTSDPKERARALGVKPSAKMRKATMETQPLF